MKRQNIEATRLVCTIDKNTKETMTSYLTNKPGMTVSQFVDTAIQSALEEQNKKKAIEAIQNIPRTKSITPSEEIVRETRKERTDGVLKRTCKKSEE